MRRVTTGAVSTDGGDGQASGWATMKRVAPYLWPKGEAWVKRRVVGALLFLLMAALSSRIVWDHYRFEDITPGIGLPQWWYSIWLPLLSLAIAGRALGLFIRRGRRP